MAGTESTARQRRLPKLEPRVVELDDDDDDDDDSGITTTTSPPEPETRPAARKRRPTTEEEDEYSPYLDIVRVLTFLLLASCGLSYLVSGGESYFWGMKNKPDYLKLSWWKMQYTGPRYMTLDELAGYDGTDTEKPIYLSINGTIFDVSASPHIYGPGGSYHWFAGVDASRGFVTGCFADDRTGDVRGVEEMFLPLDNEEVDKHWAPAELARLKREERKEARQRVHDAIKHWVDFFHRSPKYHYVGKLVREHGWEGELKPLCKVAQDGRAYRTIPGEGE